MCYHPLMKAKAAAIRPSCRTVLLATVGTSPAVLTETVWCFAHPAPGQERVVPDEVVVLTTLRGKETVEEQLLGSHGVWTRLLAALEKEGVPVEGRLAFGEASIRLLDLGKNYLEDIRTAEENEAAANLLLEEVTKITETGNTRLFASIAGGRKTMGALLLSCMCLRGREQDHVLHVLVNEPFDSALDPPFFFPEPKTRHFRTDPTTGKRRAFRAADARLELIDLPFVKMRGWYQDKFKQLPPRYSDLVRAAQSSGPAATPPKPILRFDFSRGTLRVGDETIRLSATEFVVLSLDLIRNPDNLIAALPAVHASARRDHRYGWFQDFGDGSRFSSADTVQTQGDLTKVRSQLRAKLSDVPELAPFVSSLLPRGAAHGDWPVARMSADIPDFWKRILP